MEGGSRQAINDGGVGGFCDRGNRVEEVKPNVINYSDASLIDFLACELDRLVLGVFYTSE
jgi:hypothetical protein